MAQFTLRLPEELDDLVTEEGRVLARSKHRQLLRIIEEHFGLADPLPIPASVSRMIEELQTSKEAQAA